MKRAGLKARPYDSQSLNRRRYFCPAEVGGAGATLKVMLVYIISSHV